MSATLPRPTTQYRRRAWLDFQRALDPLTPPHPLGGDDPRERLLLAEELEGLEQPRRPAPPYPRVQLVSESGKTVGNTRESNAERMSAALEPRHGPLTVVPA